MADADPELSALLPRDQNGAARVDAEVLRKITEAIDVRFGCRFALVRCVVHEMSEEDPDPEPFDGEAALRAVG